MEAPRGKLTARNRAHDAAQAAGVDVIVSWDADAPAKHEGVLQALLSPYNHGEVVATNGWGRHSGRSAGIEDFASKVDFWLFRPIYGRLSSFSAGSWDVAGPFDTNVDQQNINTIRKEEEIGFRRRLESLGRVVDVREAVVHMTSRRYECLVDKTVPWRTPDEWCQERGGLSFAPRGAAMIPIALHTHTRAGSNDGSMWPHEVARMYRDAGFGAVAITDHDARTDAPDVDGILTLSGIEHTVDGESHLHVVEIPALDFRFLAHPALPFGERGRERGFDYVREHGLDGMEKFNGATKQYDGSVDVHELATDDAHNPFQVGHSYIAVREWPSTASDLRRQIHAGRYEMVHEPGWLRARCGRIAKGVKVMSHELARSFGGPGIPDKKTWLYDRKK